MLHNCRLSHKSPAVHPLATPTIFRIAYFDGNNEILRSREPVFLMLFLLLSMTMPMVTVDTATPTLNTLVCFVLGLPNPWNRGWCA